MSDDLFLVSGSGSYGNETGEGEGGLTESYVINDTNSGDLGQVSYSPNPYGDPKPIPENPVADIPPGRKDALQVVKGYLSIYAYGGSKYSRWDFGDGTTTGDYDVEISKYIVYQGGVKTCSVNTSNFRLVGDKVFTIKDSTHIAVVNASTGEPYDDIEVSAVYGFGETIGIYLLFENSKYLSVDGYHYTYAYINTETLEVTDKAVGYYSVSLGYTYSYSYITITKMDDNTTQTVYLPSDDSFKSMICSGTYCWYVNVGKSIRLDGKRFIIESKKALYELYADTGVLNKIHSPVSFKLFENKIYFIEDTYVKSLDLNDYSINTYFKFNTECFEFTSGDTYNQCQFNIEHISEEYLILSITENAVFDDAAMLADIEYTPIQPTYFAYNIATTEIKQLGSPGTSLWKHFFIEENISGRICLDEENEDCCYRKDSISMLNLDTMVYVTLEGNPYYHSEGTSSAMIINDTGTYFYAYEGYDDNNCEMKYPINIYKFKKAMFADLIKACEQSVDDGVCHVYDKAGCYILRYYYSSIDPNKYTEKLVCVDDDPNSNPAQPLLSKFSVNTSSGFAPLTIVTTNLSTGNPDVYKWDFGDGTTSNEVSPTHTYEYAGKYLISLEVGVNGLYSKSVLMIEVKEQVIKPPVASFKVNKNYGNVYDSFVFTNTSTGSFESVKWDFGDGSVSYDLNTTHAYKKIGNYTVTLYLFNNNISVSSYSDNIYVINKNNVSIESPIFILGTYLIDYADKSNITVEPMILGTNLSASIHITNFSIDNFPPIFDILIEPSVAQVDQDISFKIIPNNSISSVEWDLDGYKNYTTSFVKSFDKEGTYTFDVKVSNSFGSVYKTFTVLVISRLYKFFGSKWFYIINRASNSVLLYNKKDSSFFKSIGGYGKDLGKFNIPTTLTVINPIFKGGK